jgi:hypothetical protein
MAGSIIDQARAWAILDELQRWCAAAMPGTARTVNAGIDERGKWFAQLTDGARDKPTLILAATGVSVIDALSQVASAIALAGP